MKDIAIWAFHGDLDTSSSGSPVEGTRALVSALREVGGNITYTEVVGGNHSNIWKIAADWLFAQTNDSFENTISKEKGEALDAPTNLKWNGTAATWNAVENAGAYKVTFFADGVAAKTVFTCHNAFTSDMDAFADGEYTFTVRAFPEKNAYSIGAESAASDAYSEEIDVYAAADVDGDGNVTLKDALAILRSFVNKNFIGGDLDGDGKASLTDIVRVLKLLTK